MRIYVRWQLSSLSGPFGLTNAPLSSSLPVHFSAVFLCFAPMAAARNPMSVQYPVQYGAGPDRIQ